MRARAGRGGEASTSAVAEQVDPGRGSDTVAPDRQAGDRSALVVFALSAVGAVALIRYTSRDLWFTLDEWSVLFDRRLGDPGSLLRSHAGHPIAIPAVGYQVIYRFVGLHHYWPYQAMVIGAHVGVAVAIRLTLRHRVDPWLATVGAATFLVFGAGRINLAWAFQVTLTGALALGMAQVLLVDHGGSGRRRDVLASVVGMAAVACSGVGPLMVVVAGMAAGLRRGWRAAAAQVVPALSLFLVWRVLAPTDGVIVPSAAPGETVTFAWGLLARAALGIGQSGPLAVVLVAGAAVGWVDLARRTPWHRVRQQYAAPISMALGAGGMALMLGRARGAPRPLVPMPTSYEPRYVYLVAALALPALIIGLDRLAAGSLPRTALVAAVLLATVPGAVHELRTQPLAPGFPGVVATWAEVADRVDVNRDLQPFGILGAGVTAGDLADARRSGKIPDPPPGADGTRSKILLTLVLSPEPAIGVSGCRRVQAGTPQPLAAGARLQAVGGTIEVAVDGTGTAGSVVLSPSERVDVLWGPLDLEIAGAQAGATLYHCS